MRPLDVIKAGIPVSLTGQFQVQGKQALTGLRAWVNDVNEAGGISLQPGRPGISVELVHYDDGSTARQVRGATERLLAHDGVDLLFGPYSSVLASASAAVAEEHRRVMWNQGGASDDIYQRGYRYIAGVLTPATQYLAGLLPMVRQADAQAASVGIVRASTGAFPKAVSQGVETQVDAWGFRLDFIEEFQGVEGAAETDFQSLAGKAAKAAPDVLVAVGRISNDLSLARILAEHRSSFKAVAVVAAPIQQFRNDLGPAADGFLGPSQWELAAGYPQDYGPNTRQVLDSLTSRRHGQGNAPGMDSPDVDYPMVQAYAAGLVAQRCVEAAGTLDNDVLRQTASRLDFSTFYGRFKIDAGTGRQVGRSVVLVQWQNGRKTVVWPPEQRQAELLYPWSME
jgi:branched-chain amino acid transport system substrate-binding protein